MSTETEYTVTTVNTDTGNEHKTVKCENRTEALKLEIAFNVGDTNEKLIAEARQNGVRIP